MAKDPAFLFYFRDFLVSTEFWKPIEVGCYIRALCHQADKGVLEEDAMITLIDNHLTEPQQAEKIRAKFIKDTHGRYFNQRLREVLLDREYYCKSRQKNALRGWDKRMHMQNLCTSIENASANAYGDAYPNGNESKVKYSKEKNIKTKTGVCVDDSRFNDPLPLDHENAYQWFREYYQARTGKAVLEVAGRKAFSANIKNLPEIIEFKRAIEKYFQKDLDALKGFAYGPEKLLWNWRTYIPTKAEIVALEAREAAKRAEIEAARVEQRTCTCGVTYKTTKGDDFKACPACRERSRKEAIKKAGDMVRGLSEKFKA